MCRKYTVLFGVFLSFLVGFDTFFSLFKCCQSFFFFFSFGPINTTGWQCFISQCGRCGSLLFLHIFFLPVFAHIHRPS